MERQRNTVRRPLGEKKKPPPPKSVKTYRFACRAEQSECGAKHRAQGWGDATRRGAGASRALSGGACAFCLSKSRCTGGAGVFGGCAGGASAPGRVGEAPRGSAEGGGRRAEREGRRRAWGLSILRGYAASKLRRRRRGRRSRPLSRRRDESLLFCLGGGVNVFICQSSN